MSTSAERVRLFRERKRLEKLEERIDTHNEVFLGVQMPNSPEIEEIVLGSMIIDPQCVPTVIATVKSENVFYSERNQKIYDAIFFLFQKNEKIDRITVWETIVSEELIIDFSPFVLVQLTEIVSSTAHVESHVRILQQMHTCRKIIEFSSILTKRAYLKDMFGCLEVINDFKVDFSQAKAIQFVSENVLEFCPLFPRNRITTLFAPPKAGKTAVLFSIMHTLAQGKAFCFPNEMGRFASVLYCDCEMSDKDYIDRGWLKSPIKRLVKPPLESLRSEVALNRPDFFVIDTLSYYVNPLDFKAMKKFFEFLSKIRDLGTAVIVVAHTPKSEIGKRLTEASCYGSVAQLGDTEQLLSVNKINGQVFLNVHFTRIP